jgi:hypothetical protein
VALDVSATITSTYMLTAEDCEDYSAATGVPTKCAAPPAAGADASAAPPPATHAAPVAMAIVAAWRAINRSFCPRAIAA